MFVNSIAGYPSIIIPRTDDFEARVVEEDLRKAPQNRPQMPVEAAKGGNTILFWSHAPNRTYIRTLLKRCNFYYDVFLATYSEFTLQVSR